MSKLTSKGLLSPGRPTDKTAKERAIEAMKDTSDEIQASPAVAAAVTEKKKMQRFNVDLPDDLHRALKAQAAKEGIKLNALAIRLFQKYLSK